MDCIEFDYQIKNNANLPAYPNPGLKSTLERFLEWVRPLVSEDDWLEARERVREFEAMDEFPKVQDRMNRLAARPEDSYIFDYWVRCHLDTRDPICPYTSVPILYENPFLCGKSASEKAAALLQALSKIYRDFRKEGNGAYQIGKKTYSNDELYGALASINHVAPNRDTMYINTGISRHCLVLRRNHIYAVDTLTEDGEPYPLGALRNTIEQILSNDAAPMPVNLNVATAHADRNTAGEILGTLLERAQNISEYQWVKDAIAVINLDEAEPGDLLDRLFCACWDPGRFNRFHGKGTQFSIAANGSMSMIVDHTYCDGGIEAYLALRLNEELAAQHFEKKENSAPCRRLAFDLSGVEDRLEECLSSCRDSMNAYVARIVEFPALTRQTLRERGILSADGFLHIALQAAQYLTWNEIRNTYISVDCRTFFRGRTEVNRPVTPESVAFVKELCRKKSAEESLDADLRGMLDRALEAHHRRTRQAQEGLSVNRYLYVLEEVCKDNREELGLKQWPALFSNKAYRIMNENKISATSFGHENMTACYFPPVMPAGLGVFYRLGTCSFLIDTAYRCDETVLDAFNGHLAWAVEQMLKL